MAICSKCLHKEVCAYRKQTRDSCAESCEDFLGWVKVMDERPILLKDNVVISDCGLSVVYWILRLQQKRSRALLRCKHL